MSLPFKEKTPLSVVITCHGYDTELEKDVLLPTVTVSVWAPTGNSAASVYEHECKCPEELWTYLQDMTCQPLSMLEKYFGYRPPSNIKNTTSIPLNLQDLFK